MTELIAWSRDLALGYFKHPPLAAWLIVRLWFGVFPVTEWSYYLLAMLMPALALWIAWRLSADYLDAEKRVVGLALLTLVPFFNFHALKFNVNTVLMPLWAATTFWFLRSYRTRSALYAALAGVGAAGCMLGKYWSVFLLAGLVVAALIDRRRARLFPLAPRRGSPMPRPRSRLRRISSGWCDTISRRSTYAMAAHGAKPFADTSRQRARLSRRLARLCRVPVADRAGRGAADAGGAAPTSLGRTMDRPPVGRGGVLGAAAAAGVVGALSAAPKSPRCGRCRPGRCCRCCCLSSPAIALR